MPYLAAGLVLVTGVCLLDLLLTMGVIRRLRAHTAQLERLMLGHHSDDDRALTVGEPVGDFAVTTVDGAPVDASMLRSGSTLVGVFSPGCGPCAEQLPLFAKLAADHGPERVLAVIVAEAFTEGIAGGNRGAAAGTIGDLPDEAARLRRLGRVVVEKPGGPVAEALSVRNYPTLYLITDGAVGAVGHRVADLPAAVGR
jgi:thiol-disulfide isomerase/thioredoxin